MSPQQNEILPGVPNSTLAEIARDGFESWETKELVDRACVAKDPRNPLSVLMLACNSVRLSATESRIAAIRKNSSLRVADSHQPEWYRKQMSHRVLLEQDRSVRMGGGELAERFRSDNPELADRVESMLALYEERYGELMDEITS
jgi:hypothetical protein